MNTVSNLKIQTLVISVFVFFVLKFFFYGEDSILITLISEFIALFIGYSFVANILTFTGRKKMQPMSHVISLAIINVGAAIFLHLSGAFFDFFGYTVENVGEAGVLFKTLNFFYNIILLGGFTYALVLFRQLFYHKQQRNLNTYYNAMLIFVMLSCVTAFLGQYEDLAFINIALTVNAVILLFINSLRMSWIAFLTKKEKRNLLLLSVLQVVFFSVNLAFIQSNDFHELISHQFAFAVNQFLMLMTIYGLFYFGVLFFMTLFHLPTAEAFDRKAKEVSSLQYFSKLINQVLDSKELSDTVTDLAIEISGSSAAWLVLTNGEDGKKVKPREIGYLEAEKIFEYCKAEWRPDAKKSVQIFDLKKMGQGKPNVQRFSHASMAELVAYSKRIGYLMTARNEDMAFDDEDLSSIETFADYAAVALENSTLLEESIEKERLERELDVAREMQKKLLPQKLPDQPNLKISTVFIPAFEVGGDYYDFFDLDDQNLGFVIADVSGKGIVAAFIMAELRGIFGSVVKTQKDVKSILALANENLQRSLDNKTFITALFGSINVDTGLIKFARAGHTPAMIVRSDTAEEFTPTGFALGMNYKGQFEELLKDTEVQLHDGDLLVLYTDGVVEAKNDRMEDFGEERFKSLLLEHRTLPTDELANEVMRAITVFSEGSPQHDDITLVILRWNSNKQTEK